MNEKNHKLMHYVLIMLMMFAPMRGVLATQASHCDMTSMTSDADIQSSDMVMSMNDGIMPMTNGISMYHIGESSDAVSGIVERSGCCDDNSCGSDCDMGMTVLLLMQPSFYSPAYSNIKNLALSSADIQIRELAPPSRPPLNLS